VHTYLVLLSFAETNKNNFCIYIWYGGLLDAGNLNVPIEKLYPNILKIVNLLHLFDLRIRMQE
jgi:hypothetical protein